MRYIRAFILIFVAMSCQNNSKIETYTPTWANDSLRINAITSFVNIDFDHLISDSTCIYDKYNELFLDFFNSPENKTPQLLYLATPDCSFCIASALDFMYTYCLIDNQNIPKPLIILKEGDKAIFEFYKDKFIKDLDSTNFKITDNFKSIKIISRYWYSANEADDGVYLLYRNHVINYMQWPPYSTDTDKVPADSISWAERTSSHHPL